MTIHPHEARDRPRVPRARWFSRAVSAWARTGRRVRRPAVAAERGISWIAGSSIGALNGAMVAGSEPSAVMEILRPIGCVARRGAHTFHPAPA